jgi:hypothetical protein
MHWREEHSRKEAVLQGFSVSQSHQEVGNGKVSPTAELMIDTSTIVSCAKVEISRRRMV